MNAFHVSVLTPFDARGRVDLARLRAQVLWLAAQGVDGFVATGPAGEFLYLSDREREAIHRTVIDAAHGRQVTVCTWDPSPATTDYLTDAAKALGAAAVLVPPPLYYALDSAALTDWFRSVAARELPVLGYNDPAHIPVQLDLELFSALRAEGTMAGMVDATGDRYRVRRLSAAHPDAVLVSNDALLADADLGPLNGVVSTIANVWPAFCLRIAKERDADLSDALADRVHRIQRAGGIRAMKALLHMGCRSPLLEPPDEALVGLPPAETPG